MTLAAQKLKNRFCKLYGIADASEGDPLALGMLLINNGCKLVQLRCKGWSQEAILQVAYPLKQACDLHDALFIINDFPLIAKMVNADGVHLGLYDDSLENARNFLGPDYIIGISINNPEEVSFQGMDYVAFGPIWSSEHLSYPKPLRGIEGLKKVRQRYEHFPLVAIGGITLEKLPQIQAAGADAWAVIGGITRAPNPEMAIRAFMLDKS